MTKSPDQSKESAESADAIWAGRCGWCGDDPQYVAYHDEEWGRPELDSRALFEKLVLDGFQAGLAWITVLRKRDAFRKAFDGFEPERIAGYSEKDVERLVQDAGIIRHRGKIEATISNAQVWLTIQEREGFAHYLWKHFDFKPLLNKYSNLSEVPAETELSKKLSKALKREGFKFCGPTIVYAFAQAVGMVNDHLVACPCHHACVVAGEAVEQHWQ